MNKTHTFIIALAFVLSCGLFATGLVFAEGRTTGEAVACVGAAVNVREQSIGVALTTYTQSLASAYSVRAASLTVAYANTEPKTVRAAVKSAWATFSGSAKASRAAWRTARGAAWGTFKTSAKTCRASNTISDGDHSVQEISGN